MEVVSGKVKMKFGGYKLGVFYFEVEEIMEDQKKSARFKGEVEIM